MFKCFNGYERFLKEDFTVLGHSGSTEKQLGVEVLLKLTDPPAHISAGKIQSIGSCSETAELNNSGEKL